MVVRKVGVLFIMLVKSLHVRWFRSIVDETLECTQLTALLGPNGCGKSSFLRALDLFYAPHPRPTANDYYAGDISRNIEIEVAFTALNLEEQDRFRNYLGSEGLRVVRVFSLRDGKLSDKFYGYRSQNPDFLSIREANNAADQKKLYEQLRQQEKYAQLSRWVRKEDAQACLIEWEYEHLDYCTFERDSGEFFCLDKGDIGDLTQYTRFIFIPAVRDAATDATEGKGSAITELMNLLIRNAFVSREEFLQLEAEFQQRYNQIFNRESLPEVQELEIQLTQTLQDFAPGACVTLSLEAANVVNIPLPKVDVQLMEDGYLSDITRKGHGIQRAFIVTLLQHQAVAQPQVSVSEEAYKATGSFSSEEDQRLPTLILAIEEPELYQHPARQRHFANVLSKLASGTLDGVARQTQVIYCTHSPLFVSIDWFDNLRLLRKSQSRDTNKPMMTTVTTSNLDRVAGILWKANGSSQPLYTGDSLRPRLHSLMTPWMNEGFFADVVVLVEGEDDRAAIQAIAILFDYDLESQGIAVIPCNGKMNLSKAAAIFQSLEISTYIIWDSDSHLSSTNRQSEINKSKQGNHCLLRLMLRPLIDWPNEIAETFACFYTNLEKTLKEEIGEAEYDRILEESQNDFDITDREQAQKSPMVIATLLKKAKDNGHRSRTLEQIFRKIMALRSGKEIGKRLYQPVTADVQTDDVVEENAVHTQPVAIHADSRF